MIKNTIFQLETSYYDDTKIIKNILLKNIVIFMGFFSTFEDFHRFPLDFTAAQPSASSGSAVRYNENPRKSKNIMKNTKFFSEIFF